MRVKSNKVSSLSLKCVRLSLDSLTYRFGVDVDLSPNKANLLLLSSYLLLSLLLLSLLLLLLFLKSKIL